MMSKREDGGGPLAAPKQLLSERRGLLKGVGTGSLFLTTAALVGGCTDMPIGHTVGAADALGAPVGSTDLPTLAANFGGVIGDDPANGDANATALSSNLSSNSAVIMPGVYRVNSCTISGHLWIVKGAVIRPNSRQTVSFAGGATIVAGHYEFLDDTGGGNFADLSNILGRLSAAWASGGDLGAKLNNLRAWGGRRIHIPARQDNWTISTPVIVERDMEFSGDSKGNLNNNNELIYCNVGRGKAVFELVPAAGTPSDMMINVKFENLSFYGLSTNTPSCLFWPAAGAGGRFTAKIKFHRISAWGHWGVAILYNTSAEECGVYECAFAVQGQGDYGSTNSPRRGTIVLSHAHVASELGATSGRDVGPRSHSSWELIGGEYSFEGDPSGGVFVFLNNCADMTFLPNYIVCNTAGLIILDASHGSASYTWKEIRGLRFGINGRTEDGGGDATTPVILLDNRGDADFQFRSVSLMWGQMVSHGPMVQGVNGTEWARGFSLSPDFSVGDVESNVLFRGVARITDSHIVYRFKSALFQTAALATIERSTLSGNSGSYTGTWFNVNGYDPPFIGG